MRLFGTDGIRGEANRYPVTPEVALRVGFAVGYIFKNQGRHRRIIIGKDTRLSGYMLEMAISSGILSMGAEAWLVGPMPTPAVAFLTKDLRAEAGVVISASHNPFEDNGIKIFGSDGFKLPDSLEEKIEKMVLDPEEDFSERALGGGLGKAFRVEDARGRYMVYLKSFFPQELTLEGLKLVVDCANGATYRIAPELFEELGADVVRVGCEPNGTNINLNCGALHPEVIKEKVLSEGAHLGLAFDGDGDRLVLVDEKGQVVDGDEVMALCAKEMKEEGTLKKETVVATVMSNLGLEWFLEENGMRLVRTKVGDRYVAERMREEGYNLGGEQSGHIIFMDHSTTGDGILTALKVLSIIVKRQRPASELLHPFEKVPQVTKSVRVREKKPLEELPEVEDVISKAKEKLGDRGRILVRPSGTEPKYRVMVEGEDEGVVRSLAEEVAESIKRVLG